jgi:hypothetical protein
MNITHLRLPELAAAALVSLVVLVTAVAPALLVAAPRSDHARTMDGGAKAGIECGTLSVTYRS